MLRAAAVIAAVLVAGSVSAQPGGQPRPASPAGGRQRVVLRCDLQGTVDAGSADYLRACVTEAKSRAAEALLVTVDTPGGALESTRHIVQAFLGADVPILVWVGPPGARAGSAGVFVTLASHFAGMAPGTNIGAAHPVAGPTGADPEQGGQHMAKKVENDAVAFAEAIARQRDRNVAWAISAVRESASVPADRAVELGVVEVIAPSPEALLQAADGRAFTIGGQERTLATAEARIVPLEPSLKQRLVHWLANPAVAYVLFLLAILGLGVELSNPGLIAPGVIGVASFVLAMVAFSALPIQAGAIALLVLGVALIVGELFVTSGLLGAGGVILLALGGVLLVDRFDPDWFVDPSFRIPPRLVIPSALALGGMTVFLAVKAGQARRTPMVAGDVGMLGEKGRAVTEITPEGGEVFAHGELWRAVSERPVPKGAPVVVRRVDGLTLFVEEVPASWT